MKKEELRALIEFYEAKAEKAYRNYQDSGIQRYERERHKAEDLADALRMAENASDDHNHLINLKSTFASIAYEAKKTDYLPEDQRLDALEKVKKNLLSAARLEGLIGE